MKKEVPLFLLSLLVMVSIPIAAKAVPKFKDYYNKTSYGAYSHFGAYTEASYGWISSEVWCKTTFSNPSKEAS